MSTVDNRAVHMTFDNASFEKNLAETMKSMDALKKSLDFTNAKKSFADLSESTRGFNLGGLASTVEGVSARFLALGTIAVTTLANITNRAVDAGIQLAKSLTLDPVIQGFQEYQTNINAIQTILANTQADNTGLLEVNSALDQLNEYADKTIYNFSEMTRNIGTFTAAGVDLDTSVSAIQGIANLAAISGSNSQQASTAMYQLSQAIATGTVRLMDWNSVVNAGLGGEVFQRALFETGKALGTLTDVDISTTFDEWKASGNSFRQSLSEIQDGAGDATDELTRVTTENAKAIADAEESSAESVVNSKKRIEDAQERVADSAKQAAEDMADALENQRETNERAAESIRRAFESVIDARERLRRALEPASEDDLGAATDRLRTAQLDQADLANAITDAQQDQQKAAADLARAQQNLIAVQGKRGASSRDVADAQNAVEQAERRVLDLSDAVERARISQNNATRDVTQAESDLAEVKAKGSETDTNVIDARDALAAAEKDYAQTKKDSDQAVLDAAQRIAEVTTQSSKQQQNALESLDEAQKNAAKVAEDAQDRVAKAHEDAARRIQTVSQGSAPIPGWLTSDVLTTTLQAFAGGLDEAGLKALGYTDQQIPGLIELGKTGEDAATKVKTLTQLLQTVKEAVGSGWSQSFRIIVGDFEQAKSMFTEFSDAIGAVVKSSSDRRNALLQGWADLGGRAKLIEGVKNAFRGLSEILGTVSDAFHNVFPPVTAERLFALTEKFADFTAKLNLSQGALSNIGRYFTSFFEIIKIGVEIFKGIGGVIVDVFKHFTAGTADDAIGFFDRISSAIDNLYTVLVGGGGLDRFFQAITNKIISFGEALKDPGQFLRDFADSIRDAFGTVVDAIFNSGTEGDTPWSEKSPIIKALFKFRDLLKGGFESVGDAFQKIQDILNGIFGTSIDLSIPDGIAEFFDRIFGNIDENTSNSIELSDGMGNIADALGTLWDICKKAADVIDTFFDTLFDLGEWVLNAGKNVIDFFENLGPNINDFIMSPEFDKLLEFMQSLGVLMGGAGVAGIAKNGLDVDLSGGFLTEFANAFKKGGIIDVAKGNLAGLTGVLDSMQTQIKAGALLKIAEAVGILTASVVVLSFVNPESLGKALAAMSVGFGQLLAAFGILNQIAVGPKSSLQFAAISTGLIAMSTAMLILAGATAVFATMDWEELAKGLSGVAGGMLIMVTATKLIGTSGGVSLIATGIGMAAVAVSLSLLAGAVKLFALMSWEDIGKGMAAVAGGLLIIAGALNLMPATTILIGPGLVAVAFALSELGAALIIFATMSWQEIGKGMTVLAGGLLIIAAALNLMPASTILTGPGLVALATGLVILAGALKQFATMSWEEIGKSMTVLASSLLILAGAMALMQGGIPGAIAVGIMAGSLLILNKALKEFAKLSWKELGKGLAGIAAALLTLGLAAAVLSPVVGTIFALGVALLALGAGFALIGVGAGLLAEAFQIIAAAGTAGIDVLMYAIDQLLIRLPEMAQQFATSILDMAQIILDAAPGLIAKLGEAIGALLKVMADNADNFGLAATAWIVALLKTIRDSSPDLVKTGFQLLMDFLHGMEDNIGEITETVAKIIANFLSSLAKEAPDLAAAGIDVIARFLEGLVSTDSIADVVESGVKILLKVIEGITRDIDDIVDAAVDIIQEFITAIGENVDDIIDSGALFVLNLITGITKNLNLIVTQGTLMLISFLAGIGKNAILLTNMAFRLVIDFINGLADAIDRNRDDLYKAGLNLGLAIADGFTFGLASKGISIAKKTSGFFSSVVDSAKNTLDSHSPSMVFFAIGEDVVDGFIMGLEANSKAVEKSSIGMFTAFTDTFGSALAETHAILQNTNEFNPTITPVLDLTQVQASAGQINGLLATQSLTAGVSADAASQLLAETTPVEDPEDTPKENISLTFIQTNNSPESLSTAKIYKNTGSQIARAKEELEKI